MADNLFDIVSFRGDKLFNGAVNIEWFRSDSSKAKFASDSFVFHGPEYHGVSQKDVGVGHGHKLIDTANFTRAIVRRCYGLEDQPFTLAIAEMPAHTHTQYGDLGLGTDPGGTNFRDGNGNTWTVDSSSTGSGGSHQHTANSAPYYASCIAATKD